MAGYLIKEAFRTITRNKGEFLLSTTSQSLCLLLFSVFGLITLNILSLGKGTSRSAEVYAFVTDEVAQSPIDLQEKIANIAGVREVRFVSKEEAFEELRNELGSDTTLLNALGENPIPASLRISLQPGWTTVKNVEALEEKLLLLPGVTEVWSGKDLLSQMHRALNTIIILDIVVFIIVTLSVLFIVFQTTENSITSRSQEIEIMELVGASKSTVWIPFILYGGVQGFLGGGISFLLLYIIYRIITAFIPPPLFPLILVMASTICLGCLLGLLGAIIALTRIPSTIASLPPKVVHRPKMRTGIG